MSDSVESTVILPDWQVPLHDEPKIKAVIDFIHDYQPAQVGHVGDITDSTQIGRWARGQREEFDGGLEAAFAKTRELLTNMRDGYDGPIHVVRSNHDERLENAINTRLPGLAGITVSGKLLNIQNALDFDVLDVTWHEEPFEIVPGWLLAHGDEGKMSQIPGATALMMAIATGMSVVCGHTHRAGLAWSSKGFSTKRTPLAGMEVGHMMKVVDADYLGRGRFNNWGNAFGLLHVVKTGRKTEVYPELVPMDQNGHFMVGGKRY